MDITLQFMAVTPGHTLTGATETVRYRQGDIIGAWLATRYCRQVGAGAGRTFTKTDPPVHQRFYFLHVLDVPNVSESVIQGALTSSDYVGSTLMRKRKWGINMSLLPVSLVNELAVFREVTTTWTQAKTFVRNVRANTLIADGDLA